MKAEQLLAVIQDVIEIERSQARREALEEAEQIVQSARHGETDNDLRSVAWSIRALMEKKDSLLGKED